MRRTVLIALVGIVAAGLSGPAAAAADDPAPSVPVACGVPGGINCNPSKKDEKEARKAYLLGLKLQKQDRYSESFDEFDRAVRLDPRNPQFFEAREVAKAGLVYAHVERGNQLLFGKEKADAAKEYQTALDLDPENQFARQRLQETSPAPRRQPIRVVPTIGDSEEIHLQPTKDHASFQYRGDVRGLFGQLASSFGMTVMFDDSVVSKQVRFYVDDADFETALKLACQVSQTLWTALSARQFFVAKDTTENHKQFDRLSLQTFRLPPHTATAEVQDLVNALRSVLEVHWVNQPGQTADLIEVRAPQPVLAACAKLMAQLTGERPQVMLDVDVYEISHQLTKNIGLHVPDTFNLYNIPLAALAGLGGQNIQQLINQLIASGGINQANSTAISTLLAQLGGQGNSIFSNPLATFGGGLTFMGLSLDKLTGTLSVNESWVRSLDHLNLRASDSGDATFHLGSRYPILNASYAPIFNSPQISQVLGNQSYVPPFPSVSYEDLGLNVKVKPAIHGDGEVSLQLELQVRALTGQSSNGVPVISNQEYKGSITVKDGEPAAVAGEVSLTQQRSLSGIPGLGFLPGLNRIAADNTRDDEQDELMIVVTPHIIANNVRTSNEILLPWTTNTR
jgi:tetratricopeptide (TPR) repeat protein